MTLHSRATYDVNHVDLFACTAQLDTMINALKAARNMLYNGCHTDPEVATAWIGGVVSAAIALGDAIAAELEACDDRLKAHPGNPGR